MKIYCKDEHCIQKGLLAIVCEDSDDPYKDHCDYFLWGEGEKEELIEQTIKSLGTRYDFRPGGAGDDFRWQCDRNVLSALGGPNVEFNPESMVYEVEKWFDIYYECSECGNEWEDDWSCPCDSDCPACGATMTPMSFTEF